ncbi:MAG: regulatory protein RecX [Myxococcaceae bacterium]
MSQATKALLGLLARRGRSRGELVQALERKGYEPDVIREALSRIDRFGYVDDHKFAQERAESLLRHGKLGSGVVVSRLLAAGIPEDAAKEAVSRATSNLEVDEQAEARALLRARGISLPIKESKQYAKAMRALSARGFSEDVAVAVLGPAVDFQVE